MTFFFLKSDLCRNKLSAAPWLTGAVPSLQGFIVIGANLHFSKGLREMVVGSSEMEQQTANSTATTSTA